MYLGRSSQFLFPFFAKSTCCARSNPHRVVADRKCEGAATFALELPALPFFAAILRRGFARAPRADRRARARPHFPSRHRACSARRRSGIAEARLRQAELF